MFHVSRIEVQYQGPLLKRKGAAHGILVGVECIHGCLKFSMSIKDKYKSISIVFLSFLENNFLHALEFEVAMKRHVSTCCINGLSSAY